VVFNGGMLLAQRLEFSSSDPCELPRTDFGQPMACRPLRGFAKHAHADAYFALDPEYLAAPEEDYHSFRAMASAAS